MNAVIKYEDQSLTDTMALGDVFTKSGYFKDVRDQAQAVVKILYGRELGFSPVVSLMGIHIIEGKPALSSNLMGAMVKRSGKYDYRVVLLTDEACTLEFLQDGKPVGESSFTMKDAQKARVVRDGSGWTKYPRNMLFARALSNGVKLYCPELSACPIYAPEELGAEVNEEGNVTSHPVIEPKRTAEVRIFGKKNDIPATPEPESAVSMVDSGDTTTLIKDPSPQAAEVMEQLEQSIEYIAIGQQKNFHAECRKAVRPAKQMEADILTYAWLKDNKYVDGNGLPTAAKIPASGWLEERRKACAWLKVQ